MEAVFLGRQTGVGVIGEIPPGESSEEQDEQERALGMLTFNSQGEETGQEGSREQRPGKSLKSGETVGRDERSVLGTPRARPEHFTNRRRIRGSAWQHHCAICPRIDHFPESQAW